jgi:thiamine-phosphate pyrophosphorylase
MYSKLQYISQGTSADEQFKNIFLALEAGCNWIQLRCKNATHIEFLKLAIRVKELCKKYSATLIINDNVNIAKEIDADGMHLGLTDMPVSEARKILGDEKIIGGTANTLTDVILRVKEKCNYIGLGPFRFTNTKQNLSPILGAEGYKDIMRELNNNKIVMPVYAIGGITESDIESIMDTGVFGIAVSGMITSSANKQITVKQLNSFLYASV